MTCKTRGMAPIGGTEGCLGALTDATTMREESEMMLYRHTYKLGLGFEATVTIDEEPPKPVPIGADWDASIDHVRVAATLILPADSAGWIHADLLGGELDVAGVSLTYAWGKRCPVGRERVIHDSGETLADAAASARGTIERDLAEVRRHVAVREARLALRDARLARGRAVLPPRSELVARFDVTGMPQGEIAALAAEVVAQAESCEEHPDVTVRVEMPGIPIHCVDPTDAPTARIRLPQEAVPEELDDWGQPVTPRSGPPD